MCLVQEDEDLDCGREHSSVARPAPTRFPQPLARSSVRYSSKTVQNPPPAPVLYRYRCPNRVPVSISGTIPPRPAIRTLCSSARIRRDKDSNSSTQCRSEPRLPGTRSIQPGIVTTRQRVADWLPTSGQPRYRSGVGGLRTEGC